MPMFRRRRSPFTVQLVEKTAPGAASTSAASHSSFQNMGLMAVSFFSGYRTRMRGASGFGSVSGNVTLLSKSTVESMYADTRPSSRLLPVRSRDE
jgi:hypothetical protein